ncbi:MAG: DUF2911 domain-containing protein [Saprospiraceae bacterium]
MKFKIIFLFTSLFLFSVSNIAFAQDDKSKRPSPPAEAKGIVDSSHVSIYYSAPAVKGRQVWGSLVPYGKVWRTGANEATVLEVDKAVQLNGHTLLPGKYALFSIPGETEWTFMLNSEWDQWGAFKYDKSKDVLTFTAIPEESPVFNERLRFDIQDKQVSLYWENKKVGFALGE